MPFQIVVSIFYFLVLTVVTLWSCDVTYVSQFRWVKSDNDEVLCAMSPPNKTLNAVLSRIHCVASCNHGCPSRSCSGINYWQNAQLCQQFYYRPSSYDVQQDCEHYQVTPTVFYSFETVDFNCNFIVNKCKKLAVYNAF